MKTKGREGKREEERNERVTDGRSCCQPLTDLLTLGIKIRRLKRERKAERRE